MKRKLTKMMAALALLVGLMIPLGMWGQNPVNGGEMTREDVTILNEDFDDKEANGWNLDGKTSFQGSTNDWSLQLASNKGEGSAQTPAFSNLVGASATLTFKAVSSGSADRTLTITGNSCLVEGENFTTITATSTVNTFTIAITGASTTSTITFSAGSGQGTKIDDVLVYYSTGGGTPTVATPTFDPAAGEVTSGTGVEISCDTEDATIYYTTDGSTPTTSSSVYSAAITVNAAMTIKAIGVKSGYNNSAVAEAAYTIATVAIPTFDPAAGAVASGTEVSISCSTSGATIYYTTDGSNPTTSSTAYTGAITVDADMTIKAIGVKSGYNNSEVAEAAYTIIVPVTGYSIDFESDLSTYVDWEMTNMGNGNTDITAHGGSKYGANINANGNAVTTASITTKATIANPGTLTCYVSKTTKNTTASTWYIEVLSDGTTWTEVATKDATNMEKGTWVEFSANLSSYHNVYVRVRYQGSNAIRTIDDLTLTTVEPSTDPSITVDPDSVNEDAEEHDGTLDLTYENLTITEMSDFGIQYYDAEGEEISDPDWIMVVVAEQDPQIGEGYVVSYSMEENINPTRTAYFKVFAMGDEDFVYSNLVTVTQAAYVIPSGDGGWVLTDLTDLTGDDVFVIVGTNDLGDHWYAMSNDGGTSNAPSAVSVTVANNKITSEVATTLQWTISGDATNGYTFYPYGSTTTWLYCTNTNNGVRVGSEENNTFTTDEGYLKHVFTSRYVGIYNSQDWRCYTDGPSHQNIGGQSFAFYKKVVAGEPCTLSVEGYEDGTKGGYALIASPYVVDPSQIGLTVGDYDLYEFDQKQEKEWRNYKAHPFYLKPGKGYLYAHKTDDVEVSLLSGAPYTGDGEIPLTQGSGNLADWNLVGNPFGQEATISNDCYVMNGDGSGITTTTSHVVAAAQGVFVKYAQGETVATFELNDGDGTNSVQNEDRLVLNLVRDRGTLIDRAIVRMGEGRQMTKFTLFENNTKLYIPLEDDDYAIVRSEAQGELPVSFRAGENGTYTLAVEAENVEMNYLHLIDNMTGMDIDLLQTPSYTFNAKVNDYESRFKLVFAANGTDEVDESSFAFFSNGNLIVNNEGNATLQVIDINGRILSSETISGSCSKAINATTGVYMLRLINGDNVKVQKVVVR